MIRGRGLDKSSSQTSKTNTSPLADLQTSRLPDFTPHLTSPQLSVTRPQDIQYSPPDHTPPIPSSARPGAGLLRRRGGP